MIHNHSSQPDPEPSDWPVLVTGAGGFVGGHIARHLAQAGHRVRGLTRSHPVVETGDPDIEWVIGDLREPEVRTRSVAGMLGVVHAAAWVSLGRDRLGLGNEVNVVATRELVEESRRAGVRRFIYTSTLHTLAAGSADCPADEATPWNLQCVDSPYCRSKREAEKIVRCARVEGFETLVLCPGMVLGPRDPKPTSTRILHALAGHQVAVIPQGGIPVVDANVLAITHRRALSSGIPGERYAIAGPYVSYPELARLVGTVTGRPRIVLTAPDLSRVPLKLLARLAEALDSGTEFSITTVAGAFLSLHVTGRRADSCFRLKHPSPLDTVHSALRSRLGKISRRN